MQAQDSPASVGVHAAPAQTHPDAPVTSEPEQNLDVHLACAGESARQVIHTDHFGIPGLASGFAVKPT